MRLSRRAPHKIYAWCVPARFGRRGPSHHCTNRRCLTQRNQPPPTAIAARDRMINPIMPPRTPVRPLIGKSQQHAVPQPPSDREERKNCGEEREVELEHAANGITRRREVNEKHRRTPTPSARDPAFLNSPRWKKYCSDPTSLTARKGDAQPRSTWEIYERW